MLKNILLVLLAAYLVWEIIEHTVFPIYWLIRDRKKKRLCGEPGMIGQEVMVRTWGESEGRVLAHGELWKAVGHESFAPGDTAVVQGIEGLTLTIAREPQPQPEMQDF